MANDMQRIHVHMDDAALKEIDDWRRKQDDLPPRAVAIRCLVHQGIMLDALHGQLEALFKDGAVDEGTYRSIIEKIGYLTK